MSDVRAKKSGFAAEAQAKTDAKYDVAVARDVMRWVESTLRRHNDSTPVNTSGLSDDVYETLKNGFVLIRLLKAIAPQHAPSKFTEKPATMPFKIMEVVNKFTDGVTAYGVSRTEIFQTVDLTERQNLYQVVMTLSAFSRKAMQHGHPGVGPKESDKNVRNFSDEQMRAGQSVIGLQMGTNKGANQSGMNIGNTRHIVD